jgi:hypothetical protein
VLDRVDLVTDYKIVLHQFFLAIYFGCAGCRSHLSICKRRLVRTPAQSGYSHEENTIEYDLLIVLSSRREHKCGDGGFTRSGHEHICSARSEYELRLLSPSRNRTTMLYSWRNESCRLFRSRFWPNCFYIRIRHNL